MCRCLWWLEVGKSLIPQHPHHWLLQFSLTVGLTLPWEQAENWMHTVPCSMTGSSFPHESGMLKTPLCTSSPSEYLHYCAPSQPSHTQGHVLPFLTKNSKELKACTWRCHHQDKITHWDLFHWRRGEMPRCQSAVRKWTVALTGMHNSISKTITTNGIH